MMLLLALLRIEERGFLLWHCLEHLILWPPWRRGLHLTEDQMWQLIGRCQIAILVCRQVSAAAVGATAAISDRRLSRLGLLKGDEAEATGAVRVVVAREVHVDHAAVP